MKVVLCQKYGSHADLVVKDVPPPDAPGADEVQVDISARGISFSDLVRIAGDYQDKQEPPFVVGGEGAGVITALGNNVDTFQLGDKVLVSGGCVEKVNVAASGVSKLPADVDLDAAAAYGSNYLTGLSRPQARQYTTRRNAADPRRCQRGWTGRRGTR